MYIIVFIREDLNLPIFGCCKMCEGPWMFTVKLCHPMPRHTLLATKQEPPDSTCSAHVDVCLWLRPAPYNIVEACMVAMKCEQETGLHAGFLSTIHRRQRDKVSLTDDQRVSWPRVLPDMICLFLWLLPARVILTLQLLWMFPILWFSEDLLIAAQLQKHTGRHGELSAESL